MLTQVRVSANVAAAGALVLAGCAYLVINDPNNPAALMPKCPTKYVTGLDCPFCGGLRMVHDVLHGQWSAAIHANVVLLVGLPILVLYLFRGQLPPAAARAFGRLPRRGASIALIALLVGWTVLRNLPGFPLQPLS